MDFQSFGNIMELHPRSFVDGILWPALSSPSAASLLAMLFQLEQSQWLSAECLRQRQMKQAALVFRHALASVPFYRRHYGELAGGVFDEPLWQSLPILERSDIQDNFELLKSTRPPERHGRPVIYGSSGSSGRPITVLGTEVTRHYWKILTLRDHIWHKRDFSGKLAAIRSKVQRASLPGWFPASDGLSTGPCCMLNISEDIDAQLNWLALENPDYLITHPSNLYALAQRALERGIRPNRLREVRTFGEMLRPDLRVLCQRAWGSGLTDMYSAEEVGYIALQCPQGEHYHVQAENLLVEILDQQGNPCGPGEVGSVVVTTLHNFAMPLIRYRLRDFAEVGATCDCGRGLPVLKRIVGRQRNMLTLPDGRRHWPSFPGAAWTQAAPVRQFQLVQHDLNRIEVRLVCARPLRESEQNALRAMLTDQLGYPFLFVFTFQDQFESTPNSKYEDFISRISG